MVSTVFLLGCVPTRLLLAHVAAHATRTRRHALAGVLFLVAVGFTVVYATAWRREAIWWHEWRPLHALNMAAAAGALLLGDGRVAAAIIVADVCLGLTVHAHATTH